MSVETTSNALTVFVKTSFTIISGKRGDISKTYSLGPINQNFGEKHPQIGAKLCWILLVN